MLKRYCGAALVALGVVSGCGLGPASAADAGGQFAVRGAGFATCQHYLRAHELKANEWYLFFGWLDGYLSAFNEKSAETFDVAPWQSTELIAEIVRNVCARDAAQYFYPVVRTVVSGLDEQKLATAEAKKSVDVGENTALIYPTTLRKAQLALAERGHFDGEASGEFDAKTQAAIEAFQAKHNIPVNGLPGPVTLWALLVEQLK